MSSWFPDTSHPSLVGWRDWARRLVPPRTLHTQISLLLLAMAAALCLLTGVVLGDVAKREMMALSGRTLEEVARQLARELAALMSERHRNVALLAEQAELRGAAVAPERKRALLARFRASYPEFSWIGVSDAPTGVVLAATDGLLEGSSIAGRPVFDQAKAGMFVGDVHEAVRLANLMPRSPDGSPIRFVDIAAPVQDEAGQTVAVLSTHLSWDWARRTRDTVLRAVHARLGLQLYVVNGGGNVLLTGSDDVPLGKSLADLVGTVPQTGWTVRRWSDGVEYLTVAMPSGALGQYPGLGWTVVARQPLATAVDPVQSIARGFYLGSAAIGAVALLIGWWVAGRIVRPMRQLAQAASQAADGQRLPAVPWAQGTNEAATLLRAVHRFVGTTAAREARYRALVDATAAIVWTTDADGAMSARNPSWEAFTGQSQAQCRGWGWLDAIHPDDRQQAMQAWSQAVQAGTVYQTQYRLRRHDGLYRVTTTRGVPVHDATGAISEWIGTNTDVTERRAAEAALRERDLRLRVATEAAGIGSWCLEIDSGRLHADAPLRTWLGTGQASESDPYGGWLARVHPDDRARIEGALRRAAEGLQEYDEEMRVDDADEERWIQGRAVLERDELGRPRRLVGCAIDISRGKGIELALREADARKDEFLAMLAHELRNPLAPLTNALRLLRRSAALQADERASVTMAERQTHQLTRLVDDLLEVSRITQGKISLRRAPLSLSALARHAADSVAPAIEARGQRLLVTVPAEEACIHADHARLLQVLENLLNNASKYTDAGGEIHLHVEALPGESTITVSDNGTGIPPEALPRLFDLFSQVDATIDRAQGGLGIGLALVKRLVELHGGTVSAHSAGRGHGASFTVRLPA